MFNSIEETYPVRDQSQSLLVGDDVGIILAGPSKANRDVQSSSSSHCTGHLVLGRDNGTRVQAESLLEANSLYVLNTVKNIAQMQEQKEFLFGWDPKKLKRHFFDVFVTLTSGERIAFAIKPEGRLRSRGKQRINFEEHMQTVAWWAFEKNFADDIRIFTEADLDPIELHNAKVLAAVRNSDPAADAAARQAVSDLPLGGGATLHELTASTGIDARGYQALIRLIRLGEARLQTREKIGPTTVIVSARCRATAGHFADLPVLIAQSRPQLSAA